MVNTEIEQKLEDLEAVTNAMQDQMVEEECLTMVVASITSLTKTMRCMEGRLDGFEQHLRTNYNCNREDAIEKSSGRRDRRWREGSSFLADEEKSLGGG